MRERTIVWHVPCVERCSLEGLRDDTDSICFSRSQEVDRAFESIDLGGAARLAWGRMILAPASAGRKPHTGKVAETIVGTLVGSNANITLVMVTVRPQAFSRTKVSRTGEIAHGPETRPETTDITFTRK